MRGDGEAAAAMPAAGAHRREHVWRMRRAQGYPTRPVTFVVPFAAGGGTEFLARLLGQRLEQRLGKPFVIENRPGGGGVTGAVSVARAAPDGHTILMAPAPGHGDQRQPAQEASVRSGRRLRAARARRRQPLRARRYPFAAGAIGAGPHQARQGQARPTGVRFGRCRYAASSLSAPVPEQDRHRDDARPLPRLGAGPHRRRGRTCSAHVQRCAAGARA